MSDTVLVTGASSGIGRATVELFARRGWNVIATMRQPAEGAALLKLGIVTVLPMDVTVPAAIQAAIAQGIALYDTIDVVVNNAGYGLVGPFEATTDEQIRRQFETNVFGVMNVTREILPHFRERKSGILINVASVGGRITFPLYSSYHATKWAVEGFTESLQFELAPLGIQVKLIEPGPIKTDFYHRSLDVASTGDNASYASFVARAMPALEKAGQDAPGPEVVADAIYEAATGESPRLRYSANSRGILALRKLLPDDAFFGVVRRAILK